MTINISARFNPPFLEITNVSKVTISMDDGVTLGDFFEQIILIYGSKIREIIFDPNQPNGFHSRFMLIVNFDNSLASNPLDRRLKEGDSIFMSHEYYGG